jgi:hypothetical protein
MSPRFLNDTSRFSIDGWNERQELSHMPSHPHEVIKPRHLGEQRQGKYKTPQVNN